MGVPRPVLHGMSRPALAGEAGREEGRESPRFRPTHQCQLPRITGAGGSAKEAEAARDKAVDAINSDGACSLAVSGGLAKLCDTASDMADIDPFNVRASLVVAASSAAAAPLPVARAALEQPACRAVGQACDGAAARCCGWAPSECDLRPASPTFGTCKSRTGAKGRTCANQGGDCSADWQCCGQLKCGAASGAPGGPRQCTAAPEHAALTVNVTVPAGQPGETRYDPAVQRGLLSALRHWLLHEGGGVADIRVAGYQPLASPGDAAWRADPTYRFELVLGAETRAGVEHAVTEALRVLGGGGGGGKGSGAAALCRLQLQSQGPGATFCSMAQVGVGRRAAQIGLRAPS
jgi:hypothetical protein